MPRNYYVVLGVPLDAEPGAIRSAFRRLALRYHPDRGDGADPRMFQEVAEAYDVLADPERRARYDRRLGRRRFDPAGPEDFEASVSDPVDVAGRPETVRPSLDALIDRFARNVARFDPPKAERPEPLNFELILSRHEAEHGVKIPFRVPVFAPCRSCGGTGQEWVFPCTDCGGAGRLVDHAVVEVGVPPRVRDRAVLDVPLDDLGVRNLWLRIHVRVGS